MTTDNKYSELDNILDNALKSNPGFELPDNFADKVTARYEKQFAWRQYIKEFLIYLSAITGILCVTVAMMVLLLQETWSIWLNAFSSNIGIVIGSFLILLFILFIDRVLLKYASYKGFGKLL